VFLKVNPEFTVDVEDDLDQSTVFIKCPALAQDPRDVNDKSLMPKAFVDEVCIMEILSKHPHPDIVRQHECRVRSGQVTGLLVERPFYPRYLGKR